MNSNLSLNVVNSILNSSFRKHMTVEYVTLLNNHTLDDDTFYGIVLQNSEYHLQRYKKAGKQSKKSKIEFNKCVDFILKHYIYYLKETGKQEADEIQISFEKKSGVIYDREEIHKLLGYKTLDKKRKRTVIKDKVVKKAKLNEVRDESCDEPKEETSKVVFFINFLIMTLAMVLHFSKLGFLIFN
jgi:hypothetical protein